MPRYFLKQFNRRIPGASVSKLFAEWAIDAPDQKAAIAIATGHLNSGDFWMPDDFAILRDETGKIVWEKEAQA